MAKFQAPIGMHDLFEEDLKYFQKIEKTCSDIVEFYGFQKIEPPILEETQLFEKGTGSTTDIVQKQMFSLRTRGGDNLTLRPELTPSIVRAYIQHGMQNLPKPVKIWYFGPCFRHERPQAGRFRQFHQFGLESLGVQDPLIDAQIIQITYKILNDLGFRNLVIEINSIGDSQCRPYYKKILVNYLRAKKASLCGDCKRRVKENPLRIFDCKHEKCQEVVRSAPQILDHLCKECHNHFKDVLEFLDELDLPYRLNPCLVRGLDYYTKTVFEIFQGSEPDLKAALGGGGRYDNLVRLLGGKNTAACGVACGVERIISLMKELPQKSKEGAPASVFLAQVGQLSKRKSLKLFEEFRKEKIKVAESLHRDSLSSQLQIADKLKVRYALILGEKEALDGEIIIREMASGRQQVIPMKRAVSEIKKKLKIKIKKTKH